MIPVSFVVGRFNPPTKGHQELIKLLYDYKVENGKLMLFIVEGIETSKNKHNNPLSGTKRKKFLKILFPELTVDIILSPYHIFDILEVQNMTPKYWITGNDRIDGYRKLLNHINVNCSLVGIDRIKSSERKISATLARNAARDNNFELFQTLIPFNTDREQAIEIFKKIQDSRSDI
jgi:nicotinamide mononucleotide adenylyltransferase